MQPKPLRALPVKKYVPFTEIEWKYVQRKYLSDNMKDLQRMVDLMSMWICRMHHDTPVIIGISHMVLHAHLNGKKQFCGTASVDRADLGQIYGSTITRFINYVNEVCQDQKQTLSIAYAVSKLYHPEQMGIPSWVVNIRHQATHGQMPPVNLMKEAISFCRRWLWRKHWSLPFNEAIKEHLSREEVEHQREVRKSFVENRAVNTLRGFREWRKRFRSLDHFHSGKGLPLEKVRIDIEHLLDQHPDEFIVFFAKSCLARCQMSPAAASASQQPSNEAAAAECSSTSLLPNGDEDADGEEEEEEEYDDDPDPGCSLFCIDEDTSYVHEDIPLMLLRGDVMSREKCMDIITGLEQDYYRPIFVLINNKGCLQRLLVELTRLVSLRELHFGELRRVAGWANLLLRAYLESADTVSMQNWRLILKHTVLSPQFFADECIAKILDVLGLADRCRNRLDHLLKITGSVPQQNGSVRRRIQNQQTATMPTTTPSSSSSMHNNNNAKNILDMSLQSVKSLSDLQERIRSDDLANSTFVRDPLTLEDAWSIAQPDELGPLGLTADQRPDTLCLTLGEFGEQMRAAAAV